jgi:hypothetical protein
MTLPKPDPPRLFGATPEERERSRGPTLLRLEWDPIAGVVGYEIMVDGGTPTSAQSGDQIGPFDPNTLHEAAIRALDSTGGSTSWSDSFANVTRPPTPPLPERLPIDLSVWAIVLRWSVQQNFPGGDQAQIELYRSLESDPYTVLARLSLEEKLFVDDTDPEMRPKQYALVTLVPRAAVPSDILKDDNRSFLGPPTEARYPLRIQARSSVSPVRANVVWTRQYSPPVF